MLPAWIRCVLAAPFAFPANNLSTLLQALPLLGGCGGSTGVACPMPANNKWTFRSQTGLWHCFGGRVVEFEPPLTLSSKDRRPNMKRATRHNSKIDLVFYGWHMQRACPGLSEAIWSTLCCVSSGAANLTLFSFLPDRLGHAGTRFSRLF